MDTVRYANVGGIRDSVKQEITLEYCRNQNKDICVLSETHVNHEQIHQIRNNWLRPFFSPLEILFQKAYLYCYTQAFLMLLRLIQIQTGDLCPSKLPLLMKEFFVPMLLLGIVTANNWLGDASLKNYKII